MTSRRPQLYDTNVDLNYILGALGIIKGYPICASCGRKVVIPLTSGKKKTTSCPYCHHPNMAVRWGDRVFYGHPHPYTYETVITALREMNSQDAEGTFDPEKWTKKSLAARLFETTARRWLEDRERDKDNGIISESYYGNLKTYVNVHFLAEFKITDADGSPRVVTLKDKDITKMKIGDIQDFYNELPGAPKQKKNIIDELKRVFTWLVLREEITQNQVPLWGKLKTAPIIEKEPESCTYDEQMKDLEQIPENDRDIFEFLMESGVRPAEGCALMKIDIYQLTQESIIRHNYSEGKLTERPKQKKEYVIQLSDRAWELAKKNMNDPENTTPFVFWNRRIGKGYTYKVLNRIWSKYTVSGVSLYGSTRHSLPEQMFAAGADPKMVQNQMRHASLKTTMKYSHPSKERTRQLLNRRSGNVIPLKKDVGES